MVERMAEGWDMGLEMRRRRGEDQRVRSRLHVPVLEALEIPLCLILRTCLGGRDFKNKGTGVSDLQNE